MSAQSPDDALGGAAGVRRLVACGAADPLRAKLLAAFYQTADFMRNQPD